MKKLLVSLLFAVAGALAVRAQTATITPSATSYSTAGGSLTFTVNISYSGTVSSLGVTLGSVPSGWTFGTTSGTNVPESRPAAGQGGTYVFTYSTVPTTKTPSFSFTVNYPSGLSTNQTFASMALNLTPAGGTLASVSVSDIVLTPSATSGGSGGSTGGGTTTTAPTISVQPVSLSVTQNQPAVFGVLASGNPAPTYQWQKNGFDIFGATNSTYGITSVQLSDSGSFAVVVGNSAGSVISTAATLTVNVPPSILAQPTALTANQGSSVNFSVAATGTPAPTYQWRRNTSPIAGATSSVLNLTDVGANDPGNYDVVVANVAGSVTSSTATLTVVLRPSVTSAPTSVVANLGGTANFSVGAGGTGPFTYQWRKNGSSITGQTNSTLSFASVVAADAANYDVVVSNSIGSVVSPFATLTVNTAPAITTPPYDITTTAGQTVRFTVDVISNSIPSFTWRKNGANIIGANSATLLLGNVATGVLTLTNVAAGDAATYDVVVSNSVGSVTSPTATLTLVTPPSITTQPVSATGATGGNASFSVVATGTAPVFYQWRKNGTAITGASGPTLNLIGITANDVASYDVVVSNVAGSVTSNQVTLGALNSLPVISVQPVSQFTTAGGNITFSVTATGTPAPSYQWRRNGVAMALNSSWMTPNLILSNVGAGDAGNYDCLVTNSVGGLVTSMVTLTVNLPPTIVTQPSTYTVVAGQTAYFTVNVSGTGPFTYTWRKNGGSLAGLGNVTISNGARSSQLVIFSASSADNATYDVTVSNEFGTATSATNATLFVVSNTSFSPSIASQPAPQTVVDGTSVTFTILASGNPTPTYQWYKNGVAMTDGANAGGIGLISGSTAASLTITQATLPDMANYHCIATNTSGAATSAQASLTVMKSPVFTTQPVAATVASGGTQTLTSVVSANPTAAYQWFRNGLVVSGATNASLTLTAVTAASAGNYTVVATNSVGSVTSSTAALTVNEAPVITVQPVSSSVAQFQSLTLSVAATGGPAPTFQWNRGGSAISGATSSTFTITSAQSSDAGTYTVDVSNGIGLVSSSAAVVTVLLQPSISAHPVGGSYSQGQSVTLTVTATGGAPLSYRWFKDGTAVAGAAGASLAIPSLQSNNAGLYTVSVTNTVGTTTSAGALIQVSAAPTITTHPVGQTAFVGNSVTFTVAATGNPGPNYQWSRNAVNIDNAVFSSLTINAAQKSDAGLYRVTVSNSIGSVTSAPAALSVNDVPLVAPAITAQPASYSGTAGTGTTLSVTATGTPAPTYQWRKDGAAISGATNSSLTLSGTVAESGAYTVEVANSVGSVTSSAATVTIRPAVPLPVIVVQPASRTLQVGATATLSVQATGQGPLTYQWRKDGAALTGATTTEFGLSNVAASAGGVYSVTVTNEGGTTTSANATVTVSAANAAPKILTQPAPQVALVGGTAGFTVVATGNPAPVYQWRKNGSDLAGATTATLSLANVQNADAAGYDVVLLNSSGQVISALARLTVSATAQAPVITRQPADARVVAGRSATFFVVANGTPAPTYQWRLNGNTITGATNATLTLANATTAQAGAYSVVITNSAGSVTSSNAGLAVLGRSFAGTWFGSLGGSAGSFALRVDDDNTGVFLGYAAASRTSYVGRSVEIKDDGTFRIVVSTTSGAAASVAPGAVDAVAAAGIDDLTFAGTIASDGSLTGASTSGSTLALSAARANDAGATATVAGFYQAAASGSSAQALLIASPAGQAFVLLQSGSTVDGGTGTVDATRQIAITTSGAQSVVGTLAADTGVVSLTVVDAKNAATSFAGFAAGASGLGEQRLSNISTRASAGIGAESVIVGFVVTGLESKTVLIRAVGPTLRTLGVASAAAAPRLDLSRGTTLLATNIGWTSAGSPTADIIAAAARSGAFPLGASSADSVILATLPPGNYSATCSAADARTGVALVEVYDLSGGSTAQKLANISTRALTGPGESILTAGVVVTGSAPKRVLIRAAGPTLAQFGLTGVLARPQLTLINSAGATVATNAGWSTSADAAAIVESSARAGAFAFPTGSLDAALVLNLAPGNYTAQVSGVGATSGIALVEVYELQ